MMHSGMPSAVIAGVLIPFLSQGLAQDPNPEAIRRATRQTQPGQTAAAARSSTPTKTWDVDRATKFLVQHAQETYSKEKCGHCARATSNAIDEGLKGAGVKIDRVNSAKDFGPALTMAGFREYSESELKPGQWKKGDIVVIQAAKGHPDGHMAMFDGKQWVSDFKQKDFWGGGIRDLKPGFKFYRHEQPAASPPPSSLGGVRVDARPRLDEAPLTPGQGAAILEKRPDDRSVRWTIPLPKGALTHEKRD